VHATARALRLDYYAVTARPSGTFVELVAAPAPAPCVVELRDGRGGTMRVELAGGEVGPRLETLARLFWGQGA